MSHDHTRIRDARAGDVPALDAIERACFVSYYAAHRFTPEQFHYYIDSDSARVRVATVGPTVVGDLTGLFYSGTRAHVSRIHSLAVLPKYRRHGIGTRLIRDFIHLSRRQHCRVVVLDIAAPNQSILALLERLGFHKHRRLNSHYATGIDGIRMRRSL